MTVAPANYIRCTPIARPECFVDQRHSLGIKQVIGKEVTAMKQWNPEGVGIVGIDVCIDYLDLSGSGGRFVVFDFQGARPPAGCHR